MWTAEHAKYLETLIQRMQRDADQTEEPHMREVLQRAIVALIGVRRPTNGP